MAIKGLFICDLETRIGREFLLPKKFYPLKWLREFFWSELSYPLKKIPWSNTCILNKELWLIFIVQSISFKRDFFFSSSYFWKGIKRPRVSCCKGFLNTREGLSLCDSDFVKGFYKESGKSQVGCLRTGRRHGKWPNQYKSSWHFSLPLSHLCYCNQFCLACLKNIIKLIAASSSAFWVYHLEGGLKLVSGKIVKLNSPLKLLRPLVQHKVI